MKDKRVEITEITINLTSGKSIKVSSKDAQEIFRELKQIFGAPGVVYVDRPVYIYPNTTPKYWDLQPYCTTSDSSCGSGNIHGISSLTINASGYVQS